MVDVRKPRFSKPADNTRPYGSHRYDVYGVKIERPLTLFGELALRAYAALEADPEVLAYCERPIVLTELKPRRIVDFWVERIDREEIWLLLRPRELRWREQPEATIDTFETWAKARCLSVVLRTTDDLELGEYGQRNWGEMLRYLGANLRFLNSELLKRVASCCDAERTLREIEGSLSEDDPVLVRTAVFRLCQKGSLVLPNIHDVRLGLETVVRPT